MTNSLTLIGYILLVLYGTAISWIVLNRLIIPSLVKYKAAARYYRLSSFLGVPIHELSHALVAIIFGHRITRISLVSLSPTDGSIGSVSHQRNTLSVVQTMGMFFIGMAPIIGAAIFIAVSAFMLSDSSKSLVIILFDIDSIKYIERTYVVMDLVFNSKVNVGFFLWLSVCSVVAFFGMPSFTDVKNSIVGLPYTLLLCILVISVSMVLGIPIDYFIAKIKQLLFPAISLLLFFSFLNVTVLLCISTFCILIEAVKGQLTQH